jgi:hypothetical protein
MTAIVGVAAFAARITMQFVSYLITENRTLRTETLAAIVAMAKATSTNLKSREREHKAILDAIAESESKRVA